MECRARYEGGVLRLLTNRPPDLSDGEMVLVSIERGRSGRSHRHQFAWISDAWANLPEEYHDRPWAETPESLRKHALIATGFCQSYTLACGGDARAIKKALVDAEARAHGYAVGQIKGGVLTVWTPESQSMKAMGAERFQKSKDAILTWIADKLGCQPEELRGAA